MNRRGSVRSRLGIRAGFSRRMEIRLSLRRRRARKIQPSKRAGTSVKGAYDVLVDIGVITYLVPYLFLFAALIRLQRLPSDPGVIRLPGGKPVSIFVAVVGFITATAAILLSLIPPPDEPRKFLAATKIVGSSAILVAIGLAIYWAGSSRAQRIKRTASEAL